MKATLEFDLPGEKLEFEIAQKAYDYCGALEAVEQQLRNWDKYEQLTDVSMDKLRERFYEILNEYNIDL